MQNQSISSSHNSNNSLETSSQTHIITNSSENNIYKLSKRRWAILFAIWLFGLVGGLSDTFGSILHTLLDLLEIPLEKYVYIGLIFTYVPVITSIPTAWFIDNYGIKFAMYVATFLALIRSGLRALLFNPNIPGWREFKLFYYILSGAVGMQVFVILLCIPLKISETWFSASERSTAWTVMISSTNVGFSIAAFTFPRIVHKVDEVAPLFWLNAISGVVSTLVVLICITRSVPKYPPSERTVISSKKESISYVKTLKQIVRHKDMILHLVLEAFFDGAYYAILALKQDILVASGHSVIFSGNLMSITALVNLVMQIVLSPFVHLVKNTVLACKVAAFLRTGIFLLYMATLLFPIDESIILSVAILSSISKSWASPNITNMTAHMASGYISEATIASFFMVAVTIVVSIDQVIIMALIDHSKGKPNYTNPFIFSGATAMISTALYILLFRGRTSKHAKINTADEFPQDTGSDS